MKEYDAYTCRWLTQKVPQWSSHDRRRRLGDSIYDFSFSPPAQRKSVHQPENMATDLRGKFALMSDHFYYFGDHPLQLPDKLLPIVK